MRVHSLCRGFFFLSLLFAISLCSADDNTFEVVGTGECADCKENNFKTSKAFSGLHVTVDCKLKNGEMKRVGAGELDNEGKFKVSLPQELVEDGKKLKEECHAQLHSAAAIPCPAHNGLEASKIVLKSQTNGKSTFGPTKNLQFSAALCTSKFFWPYFNRPPWFKHFPKLNYPPWGWPFPQLPPVYEPLPPPVPGPKPPVCEPLPPSVPEPKPPVCESLTPPVPAPKPPVCEPLPPSVPEPTPPVCEPLTPPVPVYKPPVIPNPLPPRIPIYPLPPKKPSPPVPKLPPFPKIPTRALPPPKVGALPTPPS